LKKEKVARPERFELPTFWFVARRSIQLSYGRLDGNSLSVRRLTHQSQPATEPLREQGSNRGQRLGRRRQVALARLLIPRELQGGGDARASGGKYGGHFGAGER
jgi:hypothetical protein